MVLNVSAVNEKAHMMSINIRLKEFSYNGKTPEGRFTEQEHPPI